MNTRQNPKRRASAKSYRGQPLKDEMKPSPLTLSLTRPCLSPLGKRRFRL
jgi:hypothetical protein